MSTNKTTKFTHYIKAPFRALVRARDIYVCSLGTCAGRIERGRVIPYSAAMPRSQSHRFYISRSMALASAREDDVRDLIRAAEELKEGRSVNMGVARSQSVAVGMGMGMGIGRIDEEEVSDFGGENNNRIVCQRSRSVAVVVEKRRRVG